MRHAKPIDALLSDLNDAYGTGSTAALERRLAGFHGVADTTVLLYHLLVEVRELRILTEQSQSVARPRPHPTARCTTLRQAAASIARQLHAAGLSVCVAEVGQP